jgi:hypothetical protein
MVTFVTDKAGGKVPHESQEERRLNIPIYSPPTQNADRRLASQPVEGEVTLAPTLRMECRPCPANRRPRPKSDLLSLGESISQLASRRSPQISEVS